MYFPILEKLGLTVNESKIYVSLVESGEASVSQIAINAQIHRRNAYDAIHRLLDKGLVFQIIDPRENKYNAVDPDKLKELVAEQATELDAALLELRRHYHRREIPEAAYIFKGYEGHKTLWREMVGTGKDIFGIGAKAQWFDPALEHSRDAFYKEIRKKNIVLHLLFDDEVRVQWPEFAESYPATIKYKYLPKDYATNAAVYIFGDYVVMYTGITVGKMSDDVMFFLLKSHDLAESYRKWFAYMWDKANDVKISKRK
jgi:sugar-specific transcriptional regulator TrmB